MKKILPLSHNLKSYSLLAGSIISATATVSGQIIYTDIIPDDTVYAALNLLPLDLNNDGETDFQFRGYNYVNPFVNADGWAILAYAPYGVEGILVDGLYSGSPGTIASNLVAGAAICPNPGYWQFSFGEVMRIHENGYIEGAFHPGDKDRFAGLRFSLNNQGLYYSWLRMSVADDGSYIILKDYAYNSVLNECIQAGEGINGCVDSYEDNNKFIDAFLIPANKEIHGLINPAGDKDFFSIPVSSSKNNLRVILKDLPKNYNVYLYDQSHDLLAKSVKSGLKNEVIIANNLVPQLYYIKIIAANGTDFNATACYNLVTQTSASPFKLIDEEFTLDQANDHWNIFPNPATTTIRIESNDEVVTTLDVSVYDLSGKKWMSAMVSDAEFSFDLSALPAGIYFMRIQNEIAVSMKKFVVQH
jgi:hypothetical protein